jgi:phosphoadenosine phosphosulfate reductase
MVSEKGLNLFYDSIDNRKLCCAVRKLEPLGRALSGLDAWMTGLRRDQSVTRTVVNKVEWDEGHRLVKLNPLADWSWDEVWKYIRSRNVPYNALHDRGFPSIGCAPCTRAVRPGEDLRAGRWWWEHSETKECGLHVKEVDESSTNLGRKVLKASGH